MKKLLCEMHLSVTEKDAEIFKLKMLLGDEVRKTSARKLPDIDRLVEQNN